MKTPPLLLGTTLVFWGWQTGFLIPGVVMALLLEASRLVRPRWEFSDEDFSRIYLLSFVILVAAGVFAFTANEGPAEFRGFFQNPNFVTQRNTGVVTTRTTMSLCRWLPMIFFSFAFAQIYSSRDGVPLHVISLILSHRRRTAKRLGLPLPASPLIELAYPFFALCLLSASIHAADDTTYFWGFCALVAWALWPQRSPRFAIVLWTSVLALVVVLSYFGQRGIGQFQSYLGNLNPPWLGMFARRRFDPTQSQTEIGTLGRIKTSAKIVIRLETPDGVAPKRLREAIYRSFKGRTWYAELTENDFSRIAETNETTFQLVDKPALESVKIACYLPGGKALLPLPRGVARLEHLMAYNVWRSPLGAVLEEGPGLVVFDALYGPGATMDSPPDAEDSHPPEKEEPALDQIASELHLRDQTLDQALQTLSRFFSSQFTYSTWFEQDRSSRKNETPLTRFLLRTRSGHCEYFATAAVLLLREAKIPARYAVGYAVHEGSGQSWVVRQRDGHAWCLVWDERHQNWREFDPTPGNWVTVDAERVTLLQKISDLLARVSFEISKFRWGQSHLRDYLLLALIPVLGLLLYQIIFRRRKRWVNRPGKSKQRIPWPGLDSEFYQLEQELAERGFGRQWNEPLSLWLQRIQEKEDLSEIRALLRELLALHYRYRFDPLGLGPQDRAALSRLSLQCLERIEKRAAAVAH
jgi:protein-glutamine gamma-glutamyltransferase